MAHAPDEWLTELGRITIAASDLEMSLSAVASEIEATRGRQQARRAPFEIMMKVGEPARSARAALDRLDPALRQTFEPWVELAIGLLAERHILVHSLWMNWGKVVGYHYRSRTTARTDPAVVHDLVVRLDACAQQGMQLLVERLARPRVAAD